MDVDFWNQVIQLDINTSFLVTKAVLRYMSEGAAIVNFSFQAGRDGGGSGATAYAASNGAVITMTRALAKELGP